MKSTLRTIRPAWLVVIAIVAAAAGWVATVLAERNSLMTPVLPFSSLVTIGLIVILTLVLGLRVRSWRNGKRKRFLSPILAARTVVLAQACAYAGSVFLGWHVGIFIDEIPTIPVRGNLDIIWQIIALALGGAVMIAVGLIVERFCRVPPDDSEPSDKGEKPQGSGEEEYA